MNIFDIINYPLAYILAYCYLFVKNYGLAIILFTIIMKIFLLPVGIKQQKGMLKQVKYQPKMKAIQDKYKTDKVKLQEEMSKLYKEEGYNPLGGCLPLLIQLPIMWGLYNVITNPLTYINSITIGRVAQIAEVLGLKGKSQIYISNFLNDPTNSDKLSQLKQLGLISNDYLQIKFNFFGIPLGDVPSINQIDLLLIIPILAGLSGLLMSFISQRYTVTAPEQAGTTKMLMFTMPLMSLFFTFSLPAGLGLYWIISNLASALQSYLLGEKYNPKKYAAQLKEEEEAEKIAKRQERIDKKLNPKNNSGGEETDNIE
jgi:YidC/Oxa1 family membrane protein insertase